MSALVERLQIDHRRQNQLQARLQRVGHRQAQIALIRNFRAQLGRVVHLVLGCDPKAAGLIDRIPP